MARETIDANCLDTALLGTVFSYLSWKEALNARVCKNWRDAARVSPIAVFSLENGDAIGRSPDLGWILQAFPNLQSVRIVQSDRVYRDQEKVALLVVVGDGDPQLKLHSVIRRLGYLAPLLVDISPLASFTKSLTHLTLNGTYLSSRYPFLVQFPNLRTLNLNDNSGLVWDFEMLSGVPNLERLQCSNNHSLMGELKSLEILKHSIVEISLDGCENVTGFLDELYDFALLEEINLENTAVSGDIRTIDERSLVSLKALCVGEGVYGGGRIECIEEVPTLMRARHILMRRNPKMFHHWSWMCRWCLSHLSPQWYTGATRTARTTMDGRDRNGSSAPPLMVEFVTAGNRIGWRWTNRHKGGSCEIHWIDPEPSLSCLGEDGWDKYRKELVELERDCKLFAGYLIPPTRAEFNKLLLEE